MRSLETTPILPPEDASANIQPSLGDHPLEFEITAVTTPVVADPQETARTGRLGSAVSHIKGLFGHMTGEVYLPTAEQVHGATKRPIPPQTEASVKAYTAQLEAQQRADQEAREKLPTV